MKENGGLVNRIVNADKLKKSRSSSSLGEKKFISLAENLRNVSSISREIHKRKIQQENNKFFNRLVNTTTTMPRSNWIKNIKEIKSHKQNLIRTKCISITICRQQPRLQPRSDQNIEREEGYLRSLKDVKFSKIIPCSQREKQENR